MPLDFSNLYDLAYMQAFPKGLWFYWFLTYYLSLLRLVSSQSGLLLFATNVFMSYEPIGNWSHSSYYWLHVQFNDQQDVKHWPTLYTFYLPHLQLAINFMGNKVRLSNPKLKSSIVHNSFCTFLTFKIMNLAFKVFVLALHKCFTTFVVQALELSTFISLIKLLGLTHTNIFLTL